MDKWGNSSSIYFCGMPISIVYPSPRMTVSPRLAELMPPEWVKETNDWMAGFFGYHDEIECFRTHSHWFMGPEFFKNFKEQMVKYNPS